MCSIVASPNQHNLVGLCKRSRNLSRDLRKSFKHEREDGGVSVLLVSARLHPHSLSLGPANSRSSSCLSSTNQTDLFTISPGSLNCFRPLSLSNCLHFVAFCLSGEFNRGNQLLLLDPLLDLCSLQLISQLGLSFRSVDFHVEISFLQLEPAAVVLNFGVCAVFDIHRSFLTFCFPDPCVSVCLSNSNLGISLHSSCLSLTQ